MRIRPASAKLHPRRSPTCQGRSVTCQGMEAAAPRVLVIGLDPYRVPGPWDPKPVAEGIEAGRARFVEHGVGAQFCLFGLDGSDDIAAVVTAALRARRWECVVIGGGVRNQTE